jgi:hypothetical protein
MKKLLLIIGILSCWILAGRAQVTVEVVLDQRQFLPDESMPVAVKITNRSGQEIHLGADPKWLTFSIESEEGFDVQKYAEVPVLGPFDLESSQMATKRVDVGPYFTMNKAGRYRIVATLRMKDWGAQIPSTPAFFDVVRGTSLWTEDFGVPPADPAKRHEPDLRTYSLVKVSYLTAQMKLFVRVSNASDGRVYKVTPVGPLVSFSAPEAQVDPQANLHILYQSGAATFTYQIIDPQGTIFRQELYDYVTTHPRLGVNDQGEIMVQGGVRRLKSDEMPAVKMPDEIQFPARKP